MLIRTLSIKHDDENLLTAALLFGFAIPELNHNFLAYSLNEDIDDHNSLIYLVSLRKEGDGYCVYELMSDVHWHSAERVFRQLIHEAVTGEIGDADVAYYLLDLDEEAVSSTVMKKQRTLNVAKKTIEKLFTVQPPISRGPALEGGIPDSSSVSETRLSDIKKQQYSSDCDADTVKSDLPSFNQDADLISDEDSVFNDLSADHFMNEVQTTLEELSEMAEKLTLQKSQLETQQETLTSRETTLDEKELLFNQKKEVILQELEKLSELQLQQKKRQSELDSREKALQRKAMELSIKLKKLEDAKSKLNVILKGMQFQSSKI